MQVGDMPPGAWRENAKLANRREVLARAAAIALLLLLLTAMAIVVAMLLPGPPRAEVVDVGTIGRVRADAPTYVDRSAAGERSFFLVRAQEGILALSDIPAHPNALPVAWIDAWQLFVDPALGCSFAADGSYVRGPCIRNLDRYPITLQGGRVLVDIWRPIAGRPHN
jgi:nitrite reductase/ring-hydroxylating ferredoxin subunit